MESTMSALDKFKRRLVRDIARRLYQEKQEESEMWSQLNREYGCDCHLLWDHMRALTLKKLKRLLAAEDRVDYITRIARMTTTDWLTFDMVLVHQKVDVIGEDLILAGKPEPAVLTHLFNLVQKHNIEVLPPKFRVEYWQKLTKEYNTDGRHCSPMLLQRRWYQLKELTRTKIYDFWQSYRGNPKLYEKASERKPTKLQMLIAESERKRLAKLQSTNNPQVKLEYETKYKTLITQPFEQWEELLRNKMVVPAGAFERKKIKETFNTDNDPDIIVVEPEVETIELPADSDSDDVVTSDVKLNTDSTKVVKEVTVKTEIDDDLLENDAIQKLESMEIPIEKEEHNFEPIEKDAETDGIFLPKITSVMGNVVMAESDSKVNEAACENIQVAAQERNMTPCEDDNDDVKIFEIPVNEDLIVADNVKACPDMKSEVEKQKGSLSNFNELSVHLEFVDDGIELEDNDVKYQGTTKSQFIKEETDQYLIPQESAESISEDENNTECKIDLKLIMFPITYTIKLDHMETFKNISFLTVKGNDVIGRALAESKPIFKKTESTTEETESNSESFPKIKFTSWRLQKPKNRSYNPIQLCKNPDFNTRLKRLTVGFFSSERNRLLFSACKPLTIDLHKAFEPKLVNNTLYLESTDSPVVKKEKEIDACSNSASVIPSAIAVQSLIDNSKVKVQEILQPKTEEIEERSPPNCTVMERNKVVKLPNLEQIRLVNQHLLTAEVSPIPINTSIDDNRPPVKLVNQVNQASVTLLPDTPPSNHDAVNVVRKDPNKKRFVKKKITIPKIKTPTSLPPWSMCVSHGPLYESLITKDTLDKMLCLLNGVHIQNKKNKKKYYISKKKQNINKAPEITDNSDGAAKKIPEVAIFTDDVEITNVENQKTHLTEVKKLKAVNESSMRTIASDSGFCCWAQYRIQTTSNCERRLRHLCPRPLCRCCCRHLLVNQLMYGKIRPDHRTKDLLSRIYQDDLNKNQSATCENMSVNVETDQSDKSNKNNESVEIFSSTQTQDITIDATKGYTSYDCSVPSPLLNVVPISFGTLHSETWTGEPLSATNISSLTENNIESKKFEVSAQPENLTLAYEILMKTKTSNSTSSLGDENVVEETNVSHQKTLDVLASSNISSGKDVINQNNDNTDPIILLDDDEPTSYAEDQLYANNPVLPKGVRLILLPDKGLSVALDPDAKIEQADLEKLPPILSAIEKHLHESTLVKYSSEGLVSSEVNSNSDPDNTTMNLQLAATNPNSHLNVPSAHVDINQVTASNLQQTTDSVNNTLTVSVSQRSKTKEDNNCDPIYQVSTDDSNSCPVILKSNDQLIESTHSYTVEKPNNQKTEIHPLNYVPESTIVKSCVTKLDTNRKTILSDLMTMSGISHEDSDIISEEGPSIQSPAAVPSTSNTVLNYNMIKNAVGLQSEQSDKSTNTIKKIIISIRKKAKPKVPGSVIDLTEDSENVSTVQKNDNQHVSIVKTFVGGHKTANKVENLTIPLRVYKTCRPVFLRKNLNTMISLKILDETVKKTHEHDKEIRLKNRTRKISRKLNSKKKAGQMSIKYRDGNKNRKDTEDKLKKRGYENYSDSSDDEPLAMKIRRVRGNSVHSTLSSDRPVSETHKIVPVENYDVAVEFPNEFLNRNQLADINDNEENCILGV